MPLPLGDWKAVKMRADATLEHGIAVDHKVMRGNRGGEVGSRGLDKVDGLLCRDVFEHDLERREIDDDLGQDPVDKNTFSVEYIDIPVCDLAM